MAPWWAYGQLGSWKAGGNDGGRGGFEIATTDWDGVSDSDGSRF